MCLMKNGESGKDCKSVLAQKDKRGETCDYFVTIITLMIMSAKYVVMHHNNATFQVCLK